MVEMEDSYGGGGKKPTSEKKRGQRHELEMQKERRNDDEEAKLRWWRSGRGWLLRTREIHQDPKLVCSAGTTIAPPFRDQELERGTNISSNLLTAIEESRFAIVVISPKYVSSTWCLDELSKIFECMEIRGTILPILQGETLECEEPKGKFCKSLQQAWVSQPSKTAKVEKRIYKSGQHRWMDI